MRSLPQPSAKRRENELYGLACYIAENPGASVAQISNGAGKISASCRTSYFHYLTEAVDGGWIEKTGVTRGTKYFATPQFSHHLAMSKLAQPISKRPKIGYQLDFLSTYEPNKSSYLNEKQRATLHDSCGIGTFNANDKKVAMEVRRFMADLTHNSSAFEGVDVKYADTISFLEQNIESRHMSPIDAVILRNHYNTIRFIVENTHYPPQPQDVVVSEYDTRNIHASLSDGLLKDRRKQGRLRHQAVEIRDSAYIPPDHPDVIQAQFTLLIQKANQITDPYEQALFLLVHIPYLQPFDDCNKRTARLACNIPLLSRGILPVSWAEVNQRDYTDSLLCIYENNSTYGLCEVFVDACKRSFERFDISMKSREPTRLEITHAVQIRDAIRNRILHNDKTLPRGVEAIKIAEFELLVDEILGAIRVNDMVAGPYRLRPADVQVWLEQEKLDGADAPH